MLFHQAQGSILALVSGTPMTRINGNLPLIYQNYEYRNGSDTTRWGCFYEQDVIPLLEVLFP